MIINFWLDWKYNDPAYNQSVILNSFKVIGFDFKKYV